MKYILYLLTMIILTSCVSSKFHPPVNAKDDFTLENIQRLGIKSEKMAGVYASIHKPGELYKDISAESEQGVEGGMVIIVDKLSGDILEIPTKVPVLYYEGAKKGEPVIIDGKMLMQDFLLPVVSVQVDENGIIETAQVKMGNDSIGDIFLVKRKRVLRTGQGTTTRNSSGIRGLKRYSSNPRAEDRGQQYGPQETRLVFEPLTFQPGMELEPGYEVDEQGAIYFQQGSERIYSLIGQSGTQWNITENFLNNFLNKFLVKRFRDSQERKSRATSEKYGN